MINTLKTIYLRLDHNADTLAKTAIQQVIVKILYLQKDNKASSEELFESYKEFSQRKDAQITEFQALLDALCQSESVQCKGGRYFLSRSCREKIAREIENAEQRLDGILDKYFVELYSERASVKEWLQDVTIHFFKSFSDEWVSDLVRGERRVASSVDAIQEMIKRRTHSFKGLDKRDLGPLVSKFYEFVTDNTPEVNAYLWEYGTSAFAAKLISNKAGVDELTLSAFRDSNCILDTNILLFITLETSKHHQSFEAIEKAFEALGIHVGILHITKEEYQRKVRQQRDTTLANIENYGVPTTSEIPTDDFTKTALLYECKTEDDFKRFFDQIVETPQYISENVEIGLYDSDAKLENSIVKAQRNQSKLDGLNTLYSNITGHSKQSGALNHDVGLIEGADYLRKEGKYFILSEEISINTYSKTRPLSDNLPLSIRVSTLINILAIDNGGAQFKADDYIPLFAAIIRNGLQPNKDVFKQEDLYRLYEMNHQIAALPTIQVQQIGEKIHKSMMQEGDSDKIKLELERLITKGKEKARTKIETMEDKLVNMKKQMDEISVRNQESNRKLRAKYLFDETLKYDHDTKIMRWKFYLSHLSIFILVAAVVVISSYLLFNQDSLIVSVLVGLLVERFSNKIKFIGNLNTELKRRKHNRDKDINALASIKKCQMLKSIKSC
jgi:hypothetical protein